MRKKVAAIIFVQILIVSFFTGCKENGTKNQYSYLSGFYCDTGEEVTSEIRVDFKGNPVVYTRGGNGSEQMTFDINSGEKSLGLQWDSEIFSQYPYIGRSELISGDFYPYFQLYSDIYLEDDGGFLCFGNLYNQNKGERIAGFDNNKNMLYDINIYNILLESDVANNYLEEEIICPKIFRYDENKLCAIVEDSESDSTAFIIDPLSEEILNNVTFDFIPKFVMGNQLVGISDKSDKVIFMDISSGEIIRTIELLFTENLDDINYFETSVYVINSEGIFVADESDSDFKCLVGKEKMLAFEQEVSDKSFIKLGHGGLSIYVKNKNEIYIGVMYPDEMGYSYENHFVLFNVE